MNLNPGEKMLDYKSQFFKPNGRLISICATQRIPYASDPIQYSRIVTILMYIILCTIVIKEFNHLLFIFTTTSEFEVSCNYLDNWIPKWGR